MSEDLISLTKVDLVMEECRRLRQDIQRRNYPAINERVNHAISGLNLLRSDYVGEHGEGDITFIRNEYQQFMNVIIQDNTLAGYYKVVRYLNKINDDFMTMKDQLKQRPHNVPMVDKLSVGIILLLGDLNTRWYREE